MNINRVIISFFHFVLLFSGDVGDKIKDAAKSVFDDAYEFVDAKFRETVADWIVGVIQQMIELISQGLSPTGKELSPDKVTHLPSDNVVFTTIHDLLISPPDTYNSTVWDNIQKISEKCILPIATTFIAVIAVYDLYQMVVIGNGMHDFDSSFFVRWIVKTQITLTLVANTFPITLWIFHFGTDMIFNHNLDEWITAFTDNPEITNELKENLMNYDVGRLIVTLFLSIITLAAVFLMLAVVVIGLMGRLLEMYMYAAIAPIPIATLLNNETKGVGESWVRGSLGLSFQVFFILIALAIFGGMFSSTLKNIAAGTGIIFHFVKLSAFSITLIITILRSGQISKGMFGAH